MRLFVALELSDSIIAECTRIQKTLSHGGLMRATFPSAQHIHLTLHFMPKINPIDLPKIISALATIKIPEFEITTSGIETFLHRENIKVIWLSFENCPQLNQLAGYIKTVLSPFDSDPKENDRPFVAHATIARVKQIYSADNARVLSEIKIEQLSSPISYFVLMESKTQQDGVRYHQIEKFYLKKKEI